MKKPNSTYRSKHDRIKAAEEMAAERAKRSPQEQLNELNLRLGENVGAVKERNRLAKQIEEAAQESGSAN